MAFSASHDLAWNRDIPDHDLIRPLSQSWKNNPIAIYYQRSRSMAAPHCNGSFSCGTPRMLEGPWTVSASQTFAYRYHQIRSDFREEVVTR